jgi:hypothetical protein
VEPGRLCDQDERGNRSSPTAAQIRCRVFGGPDFGVRHWIDYHNPNEVVGAVPIHFDRTGVDGGVVEHWFDRWHGSLNSLAKETGTLAAHWGGWLGGEQYPFGIGITVDTVWIYNSFSLRASLRRVQP